MLKRRLNIAHIPAVIWGEESMKVVIAVHGRLSNKEDVPIQILAEHVVPSGYQVISFDLPEHGERKNEKIIGKVQEYTDELQLVMQYAKQKWDSISFFGNSMGAYFGLLAYQEEPLQHAWFLSPVVNMLQVIQNMMKWFNISEEKLKAEKTVDTPIGQKLYWEYYSYVKDNPITHWPVVTDILYGSKDDMNDIDTLKKFASEFGAALKVIEGAEHYFHTKEQLKELNQWLTETVR